MRVRIRGPGGQATISLAETATVEDLYSKIAEQTSIASFDIKYGYPPKPLLLDSFEQSKKLADIGLKLDGEQLIISEKTQPTNKHAAPTTEGSMSLGAHSQPSLPNGTSTSSATTAASSLAFGNVGAKPPPLSQQPDKPGPLTSKPSPSHEAPEIPMPIHASTMVLRVMPDDNSCLFRAFNFAFLGGMDNMHELRSVIAQAIQANRDKYTAVVLDKEPDNYCRWIQTQDAWGGGIELGMFSIYRFFLVYTHSHPPFALARFPNIIERMLILNTRYTERAFQHRDLHHRRANLKHRPLQRRDAATLYFGLFGNPLRYNRAIAVRSPIHKCLQRSRIRYEDFRCSR